MIGKTFMKVHEIVLYHILPCSFQIHGNTTFPLLCFYGNDRKCHFFVVVVNISCNNSSGSFRERTMINLQHDRLH